MRPFAPVALALLLVPLLSVRVDAQLPAPFALTSVSRVEDNLTLELRADVNATNVVVSLDADGVIVGVPNWERAKWTAGQKASGTFQLLRDVPTARVLIVYDVEGFGRDYSFTMYVPERADAPGEASDGAPRLVPTHATLQRRTATVTVANVGDGTARGATVSIEDAEQRKIATPFSQSLAALGAGRSVTATFELLEDARDVVVALDYENRTERTRVTLTATAATDEGPTDANVTLSTDLPFREVDLGRSADFAVAVKNLGRPSLVQLAVTGLPTGYSARFFVGGSAVPSLYVDRNQTRQVTLTVTVPNAATEVDRTVDFALEATVNGTKAGALDMGLAVRGVGRLEITTTTASATLPQGGEGTFRVDVRNSGSAPLFNVELESRRPYGWTIRTEPRVIDRLDPGQAGAFTVQARAPDVLAGGRYSLDVAAKSGETTSRFETLTLDVQEPESGGGWLWIAFLVLIAGILGFGAWWKWRA